MRVCNIVLRADSTTPGEIFSTCWSLEIGPTATDYVPTR
jgi:hypothetical protein